MSGDCFRIIMAYYFLQNYFYGVHLHIKKITVSEELYTSLSWSIFHSSHFSLFSGKPSRDSTRFFGSVSLLQSLFFYQPFSLLPIFYSGNGKSHTRRHFLLFSSQGLLCRIFYKKSSLRLLLQVRSVSQPVLVFPYCRTDLVRVFPVFLYPAMAFRFRWYPEQPVELPVF